MSLLLVLAAAAAVSAPPGALPAVRAGDGQLSCEALLAELNTLNSSVLAQQTKTMEMATSMAKGSRGLMGGAVANTLAGMASSFVPGLSTATGLARAAAIDAQQASMMNQVEKAQTDMTAMMPTYQRIEHLTGLVHHKSC